MRKEVALSDDGDPELFLLLIPEFLRIFFLRINSQKVLRELREVSIREMPTYLFQVGLLYLSKSLSGSSDILILEMYLTCF